MMEFNLTTVLSSVLVSFGGVALLGAVMFLVTYLAKFRMGLEKQKIELEMFRRSIESSIYTNNKAMAASRERWEDVNHMVFEAARRDIVKESGDGNRFLKSLSLSREEIKVEARTAFLLAPMHPFFEDEVLITKNACRSVGMACETADEEFISGPILSVIVRKMLSAAVVVAIIDGRNPNVFYEIGLAHAFGKPVVIITSGIDEVPFDIQSQRLVIVDWGDGAMAADKIRRAITETILWSGD